MLGVAVRRVLGATLVVTAVSLPACTEEWEPTAADLATTTTEPRPIIGVPGSPATYAGVEFNLQDIAAFDQSIEAFPRIRVVVRSENVSDKDEENPAVSLRCSESDKGGDWFRGSTWEPDQVLERGSVAEGEVIIGFPAKPGAPLYALAGCTDARVHVEMGGPNDAPQIVDYPVPPAVISEAIQRPKGPQLPLPVDQQ